MNKLLMILATIVALAAAIFIYSGCAPMKSYGESQLPVTPPATVQPSTPSVPEEPAPEEPTLPEEPEPPAIEEPEEPEEPSKPEVYPVEFYIMGELYKVGETCSAEEIIYPIIPAPGHCTAAWSEPEFDGSKYAVNAIYTAVNYVVSFVADGVTVAELAYNIFETDIPVPDVPERLFYSGAWEEYSLDGGDKTVNAVYTPITYEVNFIADGKLIDTQYYDVEDTGITVPDVPEKIGFEKAWEEYALTGGDITVNAVYVAMNGAKGLKYKAVEGGYAVVGYEGSESKILVPAEYEGKPVTAIGNEAFFESKVVEVHLAEGVKSIGNSAFYNCKSLKKVLLPESLTAIGFSAFAFCGVLESIAIPSGVEELQSETFAVTGLKEITFSEGLKTIGERAFYLCPELERIDLPNSLESLGNSAFRSCRGMAEVTVGKGLKFIDEGVFYDCRSLKRVVFAEPEGWSDYPEHYQSDLPSMLVVPESAATVFLEYATVKFYKN